MKQNGLIGALAAFGIAAVFLFALSTALAPTAQQNAEAERFSMMEMLLPGSASFSQEAYDGEDASVLAVYKGETGFAVETVADGYVGPITLLTGVDASGKVTGVVVRHLEETYGLGANALNDTAFLSQFLGTDGNAAVGENVDALTGATVTSKAIARGVNAAAAVVTGVDISSGATEWEG